MKGAVWLTHDEIAAAIGEYVGRNHGVEGSATVSFTVRGALFLGDLNISARVELGDDIAVTDGESGNGNKA